MDEHHLTTIQDVLCDGNRMYRAVASAIRNNKRNHAEIRTILHATSVAHRDEIMEHRNRDLNGILTV